MADTLAELIKERVKTWVKELGVEDCLSEYGDLLEMSLINAKALQEKNKLQIMTMPEKEKLAPHLRNVEFNEFLAEPLLREGSLLLDRCLQERKEIEELRTKLFEACIQIQEFNELNNITSAEEATYQLSIEIAQAELRSLQNEQAKVEESINILEKGLLKDIGENQEKEIDRLTTDIKVKASWSAAALAVGAGYGTTPYGTGNSREIRAWASDYAVASEELRGLKEKSALEIQLAQLKGANESLKEKIIVAEKQLELKNKQLEKESTGEPEKRQGFQRRRNEVARFVALQRGEELRKLGGALNFKEQMERIIERFDNDLQAATLRLEKAQEGFKMLYNYNAFDENSNRIFSSEYNKTSIYGKKIDLDELVTWTQVTNTWLAAFLDTQQLVTCSFSLKQLLNSQGKSINDGLSSKKWQFKLEEEHFYNSKFVRLRGFSVQVDSGHSRGSYNIAITPPIKAKLRNEKEVKNLEQNVGRLYLGRVNETTYQVVPESAAPPKLYNASPISQDVEGGEWIIEILGFTEDISSSAILDIDIHLTVALV